MQNTHIIPPTIELNHKKVKLDRVSVHDFFNILIPNYLSFHQQFFVHLSSAFCKRSDIVAVAEIPADRKQFKYANYSYVIRVGNIEDFYDQSF